MYQMVSGPCLHVYATDAGLLTSSKEAFNIYDSKLGHCYLLAVLATAISFSIHASCQFGQRSQYTPGAGKACFELLAYRLNFLDVALVLFIENSHLIFACT